MSGSSQAMKKRKALWRKNQQESLDFLAAASGPDIVAIEQDRSTSFILDSSYPSSRSSRLDRPLKSLAPLAPHPEADAAAKIFSAGKHRDRNNSEAKVLARIQKAISRSPAAACAAASTDVRVPLPTKFKIPTAAPMAKGKCFDLWDNPLESFTDHSKVENLSRQPRGITTGSISHASPPLKSNHTAARIPHPGASYRPSVDDHQDLIGIAVARELVKQERAEAALQTKRALVGGGWRAGADLWRNVVGGEGEANEVHEDQGKISSNNGADSNDDDNGTATNDSEIVPARKPPRPKTAKERRRAAAAAKLQAQQKAAKEAKKAANRAAQINPKKIAKEDSDKKKIAELRKQAKEQRKLDLGRRLGPQRMDVETPAVLLTEDIPESFGRLKATVNPFEDRLRSLQERNLVEYRKPTKMRARYDIGTYVQRTGPKSAMKEFQGKLDAVADGK